MRNLILLLIRYYLFLLFALLEIVSLYLTYNNNKFNHASMDNTANQITGRVYESYYGIADYLYLGRYNDSLVAENAKLKAMLSTSKYIDTATTYEHRDSLDAVSEQLYTYVPAKVVMNSVNKAANLIYLNKGSIEGITNQMGVINQTGIVGQIVKVTEHYSAVMSVLNKNFKVSAKMKKSGYFGNLRWDGKNSTLAQLEEIPKHVPVKVGDTIVTSGYSSLFPEDILIGTVYKIEAAPEKNFMEIEVKLATNFSNLSYVYVVKNILRKEIIALDSIQKQND